MKTYITFDDPYFIVNEKARKVVCVQEAYLHAYKLPFFDDLMAIPGMSNLVQKYFVEGVPICVFKTKGIAKCDPEDEWNELTGKHVAERKAQAAAFKKVAEFYKIGFEYYKTITQSIANSILTCKNAYQGIEKRLEEDF